MSQGTSSVATQVDTAGTTTAITNPVAIGTSVYDTATVSHSDGFTPTGTIAYTFFTNGACTGTGTAAGGGDLIQGAAPNSSNEGPLTAGSYGFEATYSGNSNFAGSTSACELVTVVFASISLEKSASSTTPEVGAEDTFTIEALSSSTSTTGSGKVVVVDSLPTGLDYVSSVASMGTAVDSGQTVTWTIPGLSPGASAKLQIVVTVKTTSKVSNTATFTQTTLNSSGGRTGRSNTVTLIVVAPAVVPPTHTGEPWSGWTYWLLLLGLAVGGMAMLDTARRGRRRVADD